MLSVIVTVYDRPGDETISLGVPVNCPGTLVPNANPVGNVPEVSEYE